MRALSCDSGFYDSDLGPSDILEESFSGPSDLVEESLNGQTEITEKVSSKTDVIETNKTKANMLQVMSCDKLFSRL